MLRVFEAFAGIGTQRMSLRNLGIPHEVVAIAEIDKFAIKSYEAIHGPVNNLGDISKINPDNIPDHDLFTYSFPCQDISVAGKQAGLDIDSGTRSGLLWECQKVIATKKPKYLLMENVKNLVGKKHKPNFDKWLDWLESQGYTNYWQVLNAKDYGVPQNRERVFCVSILGEHIPYVFPEKQELTIRLKDILEDSVDEKYYLSEEKTKQLILPDTSYCIDANYYNGTNLNYYLKKRRRQIIATKNS
ncbi:TPA: DNA cytosine methyltransferase [Streptococcus pyogenes]|nr:DNA cytosine methyltransferase [Streptococcus pyogenes]HER0890524.1 DNA cytosine methyltransferase [Streptococcus pyogenes]HER0893893.1 DNA cytosine methyltransferase [Streptococcus pyogenes]